jgi:serine protease Do
VSRGRIGVVIQEVTRELADSFGLPKPAGALVNQVEKGSPADKAGVEALDIIVRFDGKAIEASSDLPRIVGSTRPGTQSSVQVLRKGVTKDLTVTVGELPEDRVASRDTPRGAKPAEAAANRLGIVVAELTAEQKRDLKAHSGLFVADVKPEVRGDFRRGDILLTLVYKGQQTELKSVEQLNKLLAGLDKNATVTLHIRRGESAAFVTVSGLADKG